MKKYIFMIFSLVVITAGMMLFEGCTPEKPKKNIGLQLYSLRDDIGRDGSGITRVVEEVGKIGYTFVEAAGYRGGMFYGMAPADFKTLVEKNGMVFLSSHTGNNVPDSTNWDQVMAWWDTCITAHAEAGVKYIVQPWMGETGYASLEGLDQWCTYFEAVGEKCQAKGIKFGYHNHDQEFTQIDSVTIFDYMVENMAPDKVFFQLDLWWITVGGKNPVDYFNKYPGRFKLWHVKDEKELGGSGKMDFKPIFEASATSGMENIIVEVEEYTTTPLGDVKTSWDYLMNAEYVK